MAAHVVRPGQTGGLIDADMSAICGEEPGLVLSSDSSRYRLPGPGAALQAQVSTKQKSKA